ncbi:hypothetical protein KRP69_01660 [Mammaliicoccus sciuri]|uniref:hypothetical protein n=1 Tax=Mammaliicoccus sciuri TaxID=1296 RepID=UPI001D0D4BE9|nr:hypothetical protein [Mammaliicoccus sciuri]MCC2087911.1 hypothetical protein [Mammaliicoccus sciuri]
MTTYLIITIIALSILSIVLATLNFIDQSQRRKELEERYMRIQAHNDKLLREITEIQNERELKAAQELRNDQDCASVPTSTVVKNGAYNDYQEWEKKHSQIKRCSNCLSDDIEYIYLEIENNIPARAIKRCRKCGATIAEYKKTEF